MRVINYDDQSIADAERQLAWLCERISELEVDEEHFPGDWVAKLRGWANALALELGQRIPY